MQLRCRCLLWCHFQGRILPSASATLSPAAPALPGSGVLRGAQAVPGRRACGRVSACKPLARCEQAEWLFPSWRANWPAPELPLSTRQWCGSKGCLSTCKACLQPLAVSPTFPKSSVCDRCASSATSTNSPGLLRQGGWFKPGLRGSEASRAQERGRGGGDGACSPVGLAQRPSGAPALPAWKQGGSWWL